MSKTILNFNGLFGDNLDPLGEKVMHHEPLHTRTIFFNYEITQHLHPDLYQIFFITSGGGLLLSSDLKIPLESPCVLVIPSNRLHGFVFQSEAKGDVFTIPEIFFDRAMANNAGLFSKFDQMEYFPLKEEGDMHLSLLDTKSKILKEIALSDKATEPSLNLLLQLFLINLHRSRKSDEVTMVPSDDRALHYFYQFKKLIKRHGHERKKVNFYAKEINLSTVHLNRVCQIVSQKNALQIIHDYVIQEAKKYLTGTAYSVAEIAYFLGFKDPAHFSKFFKKKEGLAPGQLRKALKDS